MLMRQNVDVIVTTNLNLPFYLFDISNNKSITYKIVGNLESNPEAGLISIQTPIAQGLIGKNVGDEVSIKTPSGAIDLEIENVQHL